MWKVSPSHYPYIIVLVRGNQHPTPYQIQPTKLINTSPLELATHSLYSFRANENRFKRLRFSNQPAFLLIPAATATVLSLSNTLPMRSASNCGFSPTASTDYIVDVLFWIFCQSESENNNIFLPLICLCCVLNHLPHHSRSQMWRRSGGCCTGCCSFTVWFLQTRVDRCRHSLLPLFPHFLHANLLPLSPLTPLNLRPLTSLSSVPLSRYSLS